MAEAYDQRNSGLQPIADSLHFLMGLVLDRLPEQARILCVGVGTGAEILALANDHPGWTFTGVDPSAEMLEVGRRRLKDAGVLDRCRLVQGYVGDVTDTDFDAAVSLLDAHFIKADERPAFYRAIYDRLKPGGCFISAEISAALDAPEFPLMLDNWKQVQRLMGASNESLAKLEGMLRTTLGVVSPADTEALWRDAGFPLPVPFFQAFMVRGWHALKPI
ncbi:class I SAM-dependent methyltransferase [Erythrobacter westpacificensis]|uniref:Class I SAM-dependent methyltransferase n=2 Tax=Erythrobacter westpacificensis TaxID=1055231 RepID=A0ABP9KBJ9_9SPHN